MFVFSRHLDYLRGINISPR
uniref:Uncharacterized protein n=1 Tax=Arundo donax TaxID=35708 RepID=A0A0A8YDC5_ARUDO